MHYPQVIDQLISAGYSKNKKAKAGRIPKQGWKWWPVYYCLNKDGDQLAECNVHDKDRGPILRVECWIERGNQYLYTGRDGKGKHWSTPVLGEHPGDGTKVYSLEQAAKAIPEDVELSDIHPLLHKWR